jgi:hypothetical protein
MLQSNLCQRSNFEILVLLRSVLTWQLLLYVHFPNVMLDSSVWLCPICVFYLSWIISISLKIFLISSISLLFLLQLQLFSGFSITFVFQIISLFLSHVALQQIYKLVNFLKFVFLSSYEKKVLFLVKK